MNDTFQQPGRWHDFILTPEHRPASEPLTHIMSYTIKHLHPGAYYEAIVQAKNRYGWNEVSQERVTFKYSSTLVRTEKLIIISTDILLPIFF